MCVCVCERECVEHVAVSRIANVLVDSRWAQRELRVSTAHHQVIWPPTVLLIVRVGVHAFLQRHARVLAPTQQQQQRDVSQPEAHAGHGKWCGGVLTARRRRPGAYCVGANMISAGPRLGRGLGRATL